MEKSLAFVHYILGLIDASPNGLDEEKTALVKNKLNDLFEHEIDLSFGFSESEMKIVDDVHSGLTLDNEVSSLLCENNTDSTLIKC